MIKLLIILGSVFLLVMLVVSKIRRKIDRFFQSFAPKQDIRHDEKGEILYNKDEIVVLKGESKRNKTDK